MALDYTKLALLVQKLIKPPTGQEITITKVAGSYSTSTGEVTQTSTTLKTSGVVFDANKGTSLIDPTQIQTNDKLLYLGDVGGISTMDTVTLADNSIYRIVSFVNIAPNGTPVFSQALLRK